MKAMILVLSPEECAKLMNGDLSVLVRKKFPKDYVGPVFVYCKKDKKMELLKGPALYEKEEIPFIAQGGLLNIDDFLNGKVIASFLCDKVGEIYFGASALESKRIVDWICNDIFSFEKEACLTQEDLDKYLGNVKHSPQGYAIHITNLEIFDKPKELKDFYKFGLKKEQERLYSALQAMAGYYSFRNEFAELKSKYQLTCAPSNFCYVEV